MKEQWDLYSVDRLPLNRQAERGLPVPEGTYRLCVHVCLFNAKDEMLIQQRHSEKDLWPGRWDLSVAGSVIAGESSQQAAQREVFEELGLSYDFREERPFLTVHFDEGFDDFYLIEQDLPLEAFVLQESEVQALKWVREAELLEAIQSGVFIPYQEAFIRYLFSTRGKRQKGYRTWQF